MKITRYFLTALMAASLSIFGFSCQKPDSGIPGWPWTDPVPQPKPDEPEEPDEPVTPPADEPLFKGKARYVWIDASANFRFYANDKEAIASDLKKIKATGFTDVIVDVRPTEGTVLFNSNIAPQAKRLAAWVDGKYKFVNRTADFDYLQAFIEAGHEAGLRVNAAMNTFVCGHGGYYGLASEGPVFTGEIPASWATVDNYSDGLRSSFYSGVQGTVFMNPANDDVQNYMLDLIGELAGYGVDGIILDRCRFDDQGLDSDFSDITKKKFTEYLGREPSKWPVFNAGIKSNLPSQVNPEQRAWLSFRAKVIHDFVEKAADRVHSVNAKIRFGCYVGAWYSTYYSSGVNWATPEYDTSKNYPQWSDSNYSKYGYADHCDFMMLGCYAGTGSVYGNGEWTMQGFAKLAKQKIGPKVEVAGGPDIGNSTGFENGGQSSVIPQTIDACINSCDGYFVFDLCHIRMYDYWNAFKQGFDDYLKTIE